MDSNGLFEGEDAGPDGSGQTDAPRDTASADRVGDGRMDVGADGISVDASNDSTNDIARVDVGSDRGSVGDADLDRTIAPDADATVSDGRSDGDGRTDVSDDGDLDRDANEDPPLDIVVQDTAIDPRVDPTIEASVDVRTDPVTDSSADRIDAGPPGSCDGGACNAIDDIGMTITRTVESGPTPMMTGGPIVDGTYVATAVVQYNNDVSAYVFSETSVISGIYDAWVSTINGTTTRAMTTFTTMNGNQMSFDFCCPTSSNATILYTTTGNTLSHIDPTNPNRVITYTRQ